MNETRLYSQTYSEFTINYAIIPVGTRMHGKSHSQPPVQWNTVDSLNQPE
jgi:hypothetical protein